MPNTVGKFNAFRESDIRPDDLMQGHEARFKHDLDLVLEHKASFVSVSCPACFSENMSPAFDKNGFAFELCEKCGTLSLNPRPLPDILEIYYRNSQSYAFFNKFVYPASESARRENMFRPRAERIVEICARFGLKGQTLMEIGAGFGTFCEEVSKLNFFKRVVAVEPTSYLAQSCRDKGLDVIEQSIENLVPISGTEVIASFEVIEHIFDPSVFISKSFAALESGGLLVLSCPNLKGFDIGVLGKLSNAVDFCHLNYFHPDSLSLLLESHGFRVLEAFTPGQLDAELVRKKILAGEFEVGNDWFLQQVLIDRWDDLGEPFQKFLTSNKLSGHMWLVAQKP